MSTPRVSAIAVKNISAQPMSNRMTKPWRKVAKRLGTARLLPDFAAWRRKFWLCAHRAGFQEYALVSLHRWIAGLDLMCLTGPLLRRTRAATRRLDNVGLSQQYVESAVRRVPADDTASWTRLAVLSWLLGLPSQVGLLIGRIDTTLLTPEVLACLRSFAFRPATGSSSHLQGTAAQALGLIYWRDNRDPRVLTDLARCFDRLLVVAPPAAREKLPRELRHKVDFVSIRSNIIVDGTLDNAIAEKCSNVGREAIANLVNTLSGSALGECTRVFAPALQLAFEDRLYNTSISAASHELLIKEHHPDACIAITGENIPSEVIFPSAVAASVIAAANGFTPAPTLPARAELDQAKDSDQGVRDDTGHLWAELQKAKTNLFAAESSPVGILANFAPADLRISTVAPAIVWAISRRKPCVLLQRTNVKPAGENSIRKFLGLDKPGQASSHCHLWAGLEGIWCRANQISHDGSALRSAMLSGTQSLKNRNEIVPQACLSASVIENAVDMFLTKDLRPLLLLALSAQETLQKSRLTSLLIIPEDRNPVARVFTIAAQGTRIPVYNYSYLFLSQYARYKKPLADYILVPSTYHADHFQQHFGISPTQIIRIGSHAIAARLQEAQKHDPQVCRQRVCRSPQRRLIVFVSQPRLFEKSSKALNWLLGAAAKVDADLVVRLHPGEKHLAAEYQKAIAQWAAAEVAWVDVSDTSLTEALLAADLVATMWSNVGLEAAVLNRPVLAVKVDTDPPVDLVGMGVAVGADSERSVHQCVTAILTGGHAAAELSRNRRDFLGRNPELLNSAIEERVAEIVYQMRN